MNKQIFIARRIPEAGLKLLRENNISFDMVKESTPLTKKDFIKRLKKKPYDGVICSLTEKIDSEVFDACPTSKIFANFSVGYDNINIEEAKKRGIEASNTPKTSDVAVAEHTIALIMALTTRITEGDRYMRKGKYKGWNPELLIGTDIKGKVVGIIGGGAIGTEVAKILHTGFGSNIIYCDVFENKKIEQDACAVKKDFDELIRTADIVSLHCPLLPTTTHLINKEVFSKMKNTAFLINTARGPIIDEKALVEALKNKQIRGAAIDVFEFEPKPTKGLTKLDNIILTPHIASARESARNMMAEMAVKNVISVFETGKAVNSVIK